MIKEKKFKEVVFNNRKKQLELTYTSNRKIIVHYSQLGIQSNISNAWIDKETKGKSIGMRFENDKIDYLPYDQPLAIIKDPEFMLQNQVEILVANIKEVLAKKRISKTYLAQQLGTSNNQIHRLLNPKILNKNLTQLYRIASLLNFDMEIHLKAA